MEEAMILDGGLEELPGVGGAERSEGDGGNRGGPPRPGGLRCRRRCVGFYNR